MHWQHYKGQETPEIPGAATAGWRGAAEVGAGETAAGASAVIKLGPGKRFQFNYDYCKGCGMCVAECPCGAIKMEAEEI